MVALSNNRHRWLMDPCVRPDAAAMLPLPCRFPVAWCCYPQSQGRGTDSRGAIGRVSSHRPVTEICQV